MPTLYDHRGRPVDLSVLQEEQAAPSLTGVRTVLSHHPSHGITPGQLTALLHTAEHGDATAYLELAERMEEKHLKYASLLGTRKRAVTQLELTVEAASDAADDVKAADLVRAVILREGLEEDLFDVLDGVGKGYSVCEIVWETNAREWRPAWIEWRDPRWFAFDRVDGRTLKLRQGTELVDLAPFKYVTHLHKTKSGLPIRGGLARLAAWTWLFATYAIKDWVSFAEVFGQPYRVGKYPPGASEDDKKALMRAVANIGSDAAAIMPASMLLEFLDADRGGSTDVYRTLLEYLDGRLAEGVLGQTLTSDVSSNGGSRALGDVHNEVRKDIRRSDVRQLEVSLNRHVARPVVDLNYGPRDAYPTIRLGLADVLSPAEKIDAATKLVPIGLKLEAAPFRDLLGMAEPAAGAELLTLPAPAPVVPPLRPMPGAAGTGATAADLFGAGRGGRTRPEAINALRRALNAAAPAAAGEGGDAIDGLVAAAIAESGWEPLVEGAAAPVRALVDAAGSLAEIRDGLSALMARMDDAQLLDVLERAIGTATVAGRAGAVE